MKELTREEAIRLYPGRIPSHVMIVDGLDNSGLDCAGRADQGSPGRHNPAGEIPGLKTKGNPFWEINAFIDCTMGSLSPGAREVWLILWRDTNRKLGTARTGQEDLARRANLSSRAVRNAIRELRARKLLKVTYRGRLNRGASIYQIHPTGFS